MLKFIQKCWQEDKQRRILWMPVLFGLGIGLYFLPKTEPDKWYSVAVVEALILLAFLFRHNLKVLNFLGMSAIIVLGFVTIQIKSIWLNYPVEQTPSETFYFKGKIDAVDTNFQGRKRFTFFMP